MTADDPRVQRAREMLSLWEDLRREGRGMIDEDIFRDLLAVVDERQSELDRLQQWKDEAAEVMMGLQDLGRALDVPIGKRITGESGVAAATALRERAEVAEKERDELRARHEFTRRDHRALLDPLAGEPEVKEVRGQIQKREPVTFPLATAVGGLIARLRQDAEAAEKERDELRAKLARVEPLANGTSPIYVGHHVRRALHNALKDRP